MKEKMMMMKKKNGGADFQNDVHISKVLHLHDDTIAYEILSRLPVKSLMRFKCVRKSWRYLIEQDPRFFDIHFARSRTRPTLLIRRIHPEDKLGTSFFTADIIEGSTIATTLHKVTTSWSNRTVLNPVNGLICFIDYAVDAVLIYNLSTREETSWIKTTTSLSTEEKQGNDFRPSFGFGFDPTTKEHKVICLQTLPHRRCYTDYNQNKIDKVCEVLTVGQNSWRKIDIHGLPPFRVFAYDYSFYANGVIYWLIAYLQSPVVRITEFIVAFDVGSEKFRVIEIPSFFIDLDQPPKRRFARSVGDMLEVNGHLALLNRSFAENSKTQIVKIFVLADENKGNWIEDQTIPIMSFDDQDKAESLYSCQAIAETDLIIVESSKHWMRIPYCHYYCDRKKKTWSKIEIFNPPTDYTATNCYKIAPFVESLFPVQKKQQQPATTLHLKGD